MLKLLSTYQCEVSNHFQPPKYVKIVKSAALCFSFVIISLRIVILSIKHGIDDFKIG